MPVSSLHRLPSRFSLGPLPVLLLLSLCGCEGALVPPTGPHDIEGPTQTPPAIDSCRQPTALIYEGLRPGCVGCHGGTDSRPFFENLESFERLIAYSGAGATPDDTVYVRAGHPEESELLKLLRGESETATQMPPGSTPYSALVQGGDAPGAPSMTELTRWIEELEVCDLPAPPAQRITRRLSASMIRTELMRQLGLSDSETASTGRVLGSPDDSPQRVVSNDRVEAHQVWEALGGEHALDGRRASGEPSHLMAQAFFPLAQAWCSLSVRTKDTLFPHADVHTGSGDDPVAVKANIEFLFLHMLGEQASPADITALYERVFIPTEDEHDTQTAWTAVCSTLVRDPLWMTY